MNGETAAELREQATERVVQLVEADPGFQSSWDQQQRTIACVAETFDWDPPEATNLAAVRTVYAQVLCVAVIPGRDFSQLPGRAGPAAVDLATGRVEAPTEAGDGYTANLRRIFPRQLWGAAAQGLRDREGAMQRLRLKVAAALSSSPPR